MINYFIYAIGIIILCVGIYILLSKKFNVPSKKSENIVTSIYNRKFKYDSLLEKLIKKISNRIIKYIKISDEKQHKLKYSLDYIDSEFSPEEYIARSIAMFIIFFVITFPLFFLKFYFGLIGFAASVFLAYSNYKSSLKQAEIRKEHIEEDIPVFAQLISEMLSHGNRNILEMFETCRSSVRSDFRKELNRTILDIKTLNEKKALHNLMYRVGSPDLTQVCLCLISVTNGENQSVALADFAQQLHIIEIERLEKKNSTKPDKLNMLSMLMLLMLLINTMGNMVFVIIDVFSTMEF